MDKVEPWPTQIRTTWVESHSAKHACSRLHNGPAAWQGCSVYASQPSIIFITCTRPNTQDQETALDCRSEDMTPQMIRQMPRTLPLVVQQQLICCTWFVSTQNNGERSTTKELFNRAHPHIHFYKSASKSNWSNWSIFLSLNMQKPPVNELHVVCGSNVCRPMSPRSKTKKTLSVKRACVDRICGLYTACCSVKTREIGWQIQVN